VDTLTFGENGASQYFGHSITVAGRGDDIGVLAQYVNGTPHCGPDLAAQEHGNVVLRISDGQGRMGWTTQRLDCIFEAAGFGHAPREDHELGTIGYDLAIEPVAFDGGAHELTLRAGQGHYYMTPADTSAATGQLLDKHFIDRVGQWDEVTAAYGNGPIFRDDQIKPVGDIWGKTSELLENPPRDQDQVDPGLPWLLQGGSGRPRKVPVTRYCAVVVYCDSPHDALPRECHHGFAQQARKPGNVSRRLSGHSATAYFIVALWNYH
jgi:hypothetical protein